MRNQDIQALVNTGRDATVNSARITGVKKDDAIKPATGDEVAFYKKKKQSYDWQTGLNLYDDETPHSRSRGDDLSGPSFQ